MSRLARQRKFRHQLREGASIASPMDSQLTGAMVLIEPEAKEPSFRRPILQADRELIRPRVEGSVALLID